jgi:hypothetical protein
MYRSILQQGWDLPIPGRIPHDDAMLMVLADCPDREIWDRHKDAVMRMFDLSECGTYYVNERQQHELAKYRKMRRDYAERGRLGGNAKQANKLNAKQNSSSATPEAALAKNDASNKVRLGQARLGQAKEELLSAETSSAQPEAIDITMPLNTGEEHPIPKSQVVEWQKLYPAVDVMQALRSMRGWCLAHKARRKTKQGVQRFMNSWLSREQDNAKHQANSGQSGTGQGPKGKHGASKGAYHGTDSARFEREPDIVA